MTAIFKSVTPYADNALNLPVADVEAAIPFYETVMGFRVASRTDSPLKSVILTRDDIHIGLAENGGDPAQEGCFIEVDSADLAFQELRFNGLDRDEAEFRVDLQGERAYKVFFVIAPDGLCYCLGERVE